MNVLDERPPLSKKQQRKLGKSSQQDKQKTDEIMKAVRESLANKTPTIPPIAKPNAQESEIADKPSWGHVTKPSENSGSTEMMDKDQPKMINRSLTANGTQDIQGENENTNESNKNVDIIKKVKIYSAYILAKYLSRHLNYEKEKIVK